MPHTVNAADRATVLIAVTASSVAFIVAFNFGAFDTIFFDRIFAVWVVASVVFVASLLTTIEPQGWWRRAALLLPTVWILISAADVVGLLSLRETFLDWLSLVTTAVALPFLGAAIVGAINPSFLDLPDRNKRAIFIAVLVFSLAGAAMGARNDLFLTCDDFKVSGNDLPENCRKTPAEPQDAAAFLLRGAVGRVG